MSGDFAAAAQRWCGAAARLLGWRPHEFWPATPAELHAALQPETDAAAGPSRETIAALMERDADDR